MQLDKHSSVPLYAQLKELLAERIRDGVYQPGEKIPTEMHFCQELELSRPTVRQAISELVSEGMLIIRKGKGTFVTSDKERINLEHFSGFSFSFLAAKSQEDKHFLDHSLTKQLPADIAKIFGKAAEPCYELAWVLPSDTHNVAFSVSFIPQSMFPGLDEAVRQAKRMVDITANRYAHLPQRVNHKIFVRPASHEEARILDLSKGTPVLVSQSVLLSRSGMICEVNTSVMRSDMVCLDMEAIGR